jgi:hypothetical protein
MARPRGKGRVFFHPMERRLTANDVTCRTIALAYTARPRHTLLSEAPTRPEAVFLGLDVINMTPPLEGFPSFWGYWAPRAERAAMRDWSTVRSSSAEACVHHRS